MPFLKVFIKDSQSLVKFEQGLTIREILESADIRIRSGCRGTGACGLCKVRIIDGNLSALTQNEEHFSLETDIRLACQAVPLGDASVEVFYPAPESKWHILNSRYRQMIASSVKDKSCRCAADGYKVAVDLGTTNIMLSVLEMPSARWIGGRRGANPQTEFGLDIISRLTAASASEYSARKQQESAFTAISDALKDIADREILDLSKITNCTIVGNTAMLTLLAGCCSDTLLDPASWGCIAQCVVSNGRKLLVNHSEPEHSIDIDLVQPFAGFVGSDMLAGLYATGITEFSTPGLFIDFGTNTEIALWDGDTAWIASASGGPSFEASGISCGMPADAGAISRVLMPDNGSSALGFEVINNTEPKGICGSGLIDMIACLLKLGVIDSRGRFIAESQNSYSLCAEALKININPRDIDMIQRAKAGIAACVVMLCRRSGVAIGSLKRICVAGVFGRYLDISNAQTIGLLPRLDPAVFELWENAALIGCEMAALDPEYRQRLDSIRKQCTILNMGNDEEYEPVFFENLYLGCIEGMN
ncbi:MAG: DUF4445 domain-containing protein [Nitrospirae bacterium]|nr:DUF4445 domain-containing protein [Nitrospirota bacterium]